MPTTADDNMGRRRQANKGWNERQRGYNVRDRNRTDRSDLYWSHKAGSTSGRPHQLTPAADAVYPPPRERRKPPRWALPLTGEGRSPPVHAEHFAILRDKRRDRNVIQDYHLALRKPEKDQAAVPRESDPICLFHVDLLFPPRSVKTKLSGGQGSSIYEQLSSLCWSHKNPIVCCHPMQNFVSGECGAVEKQTERQHAATAPSFTSAETTSQSNRETLLLLLGSRHLAPLADRGDHLAGTLAEQPVRGQSTRSQVSGNKAAPVENGEADMTAEESWEQKGEPSEAEPGGGPSGDGGPAEEPPQEMMMEEEEEVPTPKVVLAPPDAPKKEHVNVVFIGHVDAGKSTIGGQIMYLTGMVDKRTLEKYEREAKEKNRETWYLSWALDTNQEERDKGKTVEVGRAYFETEKKHFTILDAPGHKSFVPNMIGGASQADLAVLVISARKGEFETGFEKGGQTREHAMLAKTAGVKHLIVLINKMDDPTVNWSLERYEECKEKLVPFLKKVGFNPKKDIHFMPCSGLTGANLKEPADLCSWYTGLPFIAHLDSLPNFNRSSDGPVRLPIVDKYKCPSQDMGTVILGKLESGSICKAQQLVMMPNKHTVEVLSLLSDDVETEFAGPGENLKLRLKGIEEEEILPGFILCNAENLCHSGRTFDAQSVRGPSPRNDDLGGNQRKIVIIEHKSIICPGYNAVLHIHTCIEEVQITALICLVDKKSGEKSKTRPRFVKQDQVCIARLRTAGTICLETFKDFPQMGRFTLRDEGGVNCGLKHGTATALLQNRP
ncbi:ERF3A factor, partial [Atractosteus spatula]|nr:ERF3A factor [Atractosteus spatula]